MKLWIDTEFNEYRGALISMALVAAGLMRRHEGNPLTGGEPMYAVTEEGKTVARSKPPNAELSGPGRRR